MIKKTVDYARVKLEEFLRSIEEKPGGAEVMLRQRGYASKEALVAELEAIRTKSKSAKDEQAAELRAQREHITLLLEDVENEATLERDRKRELYLNCEADYTRRAAVEDDLAKLSAVNKQNEDKLVDVMAAATHGTCYQDTPLHIENALIFEITKGKMLLELFPKVLAAIDARIESAKKELESLK